jgi:peptide/nickel transport system permease protein
MAMTTTTPAVDPLMPRRRTPPTLARLGRSPSFWLGGGLVLLLLLVAAFGPALTSADPFAMNVRARLQAPSAEHWLGTDEFGRDVFTRVVHGSRLTLRIGLVSVGIALVVGGLMGVLAGFFGGWFDVLMMGLVDVLLAFPAILLALAIIAVLGPGLTNTMIAVGVAATPGFARVVRAATLEVKERQYVEAARALGGSAWHLMVRHVGLNIMSPLLVLVTLQFPVALLSAAALGFVGLGAQPPEPEWGAMLVSARDYLRRAPWLVNAPGIAIVLTVLGFNLLGNALRDALDPTQRNA